MIEFLLLLCFFIVAIPALLQILTVLLFLINNNFNKKG